MSRLTELEQRPGIDEELYLPCDCHFHGGLRISWEPDEEHRYIWVEQCIPDNYWRTRFRFAWRILRGKQTTGDVVLNNKCVENLRTFLNSK